jgi:hypothetical protein
MKLRGMESWKRRPFTRTRSPIEAPPEGMVLMLSRRTEGKEGEEGK